MFQDLWCEIGICGGDPGSKLNQTSWVLWFVAQQKKKMKSVRELLEFCGVDERSNLTFDDEVMKLCGIDLRFMVRNHIYGPICLRSEPDQMFEVYEPSRRICDESILSFMIFVCWKLMVWQRSLIWGQNNTAIVTLTSPQWSQW